MTEPASAMPDATRGTVSLADEEGVKRILVDTILGLWPSAPQRATRSSQGVPRRRKTSRHSPVVIAPTRYRSAWVR